MSGPMTLERAVEVLNERGHRKATELYPWTVARSGDVAFSPGQCDTVPAFEVISIAERYEREDAAASPILPPEGPPLAFSYREESGSVTTRRVVPSAGDFWHDDAGWWFEADDLDSGDCVAIHLNRVIEVFGLPSTVAKSPRRGLDGSLIGGEA